MGRAPWFRELIISGLLRLLWALAADQRSLALSGNRHIGLLETITSEVPDILDFS